jgi:uncharacterized protein with ATP-grasp and redox domains
MLAALDCQACFLQQVLRAARAAGATGPQQELIMRQVMAELAAADWQAPPIKLVQSLYRKVREVTGVNDPYGAVKQLSNEQLLRYYPQARLAVAQADDPLELAVRLAIAGNIVDYGHSADFDVDQTLHEVQQAGFAVDDLPRLRSELATATKVLYFADNSGEIIMDRLLMETLHRIYGVRISLVLKSGPLINDTTIAEVGEVGLEQPWVEILALSNGDPGDQAPDYTSPVINQWMASHEVTIAKGQANYEALSDKQGIYYLLMAKCAVLADYIGVPQQSIILQYR